MFAPSVDAQTTPEKRIEDMMRLGELCIEVLQQNDEHHSEVYYLLFIFIYTVCFSTALPDAQLSFS